MEMKYPSIVDIPADEFQPLQKNTEEEREEIAAPSLNFLQDSWRRLKKNKAAVISMVLLIVIIAISIQASRMWILLICRHEYLD
jgi:oligopeptide transport system permease protein